MPHDLPKAYDPSAIEERWAEYWAREKLFHVETPAQGSSQPAFTITVPPPNVTGRDSRKFASRTKFVQAQCNT